MLLIIIIIIVQFSLSVYILDTDNNMLKKKYILQNTFLQILSKIRVVPNGP